MDALLQTRFGWDELNAVSRQEPCASNVFNKTSLREVPVLQHDNASVKLHAAVCRLHDAAFDILAGEHAL